MIGIALNRPLYGDKPDPPIKRPSFRGIHVFVSGSTLGVVPPGSSRRRALQLRRHRVGGREEVRVRRALGARDVREREDEPAGRDRRHLAHARRSTPSARRRGRRASTAAIEPATYTDEDIARLDAIYAGRAGRAAPSRGTGRTSNVGDALPPMAKGPLTTTDMIVFHAGGYGFVPYAPCANRIAYKNRQRIAPFYVKNEYGDPGRRAARALGLGLGAGDRQPDGLRLRGDARLLAVALPHRLDGRRRLARPPEQRDPQVQLHRRQPRHHRRGRRQARSRTAAASSTSRCAGTNQRDTVTCPGPRHGRAAEPRARAGRAARRRRPTCASRRPNGWPATASSCASGRARTRTERQGSGSFRSTQRHAGRGVRVLGPTALAGRARFRAV